MPRDRLEPNERGSDKLSRIGQGLNSCFQVPELQHFTSLKILCLHGNNISKLEGLHHLAHLQELNLSSNAICVIEGISTLTSLTNINLASNRIQKITGLEGLRLLVNLNISYNMVTSLGGLESFHGHDNKLKILNIKNNHLQSLHELSTLAPCINLRDLSVAGNPCCLIPTYRQAILVILPQITHLDNMDTTTILSLPVDALAAQQVASRRLHAFESNQAQQIDALNAPMHESTTYGVEPSSMSITPRVDEVMAGIQRKQRNQSQDLQTKAKPNLNPGRRAPTVSRIVQVDDDAAIEGSLRDKSYIDQESKSRVRHEVAVQTANILPQVNHLQAECNRLHDQLLLLTEELERRNVMEEDMHSQMLQAAVAAEEEARVQIEEGYKEASLAVSKALAEVEVAKRQAQEAQETAEFTRRAEQDAKASCSRLEQETHSLRAEIARLSQQLSEERERGASSVAAEREKAFQADVRWQETVQELKSELSNAKADLRMSEQKVANLEAVVANSNSAAASMTTQVAHAIAEGNAQVTSLQSKLATAEQQLTDLQRREAESRLEINMLTSSLSKAQAQHQKELEEARAIAAAELQSTVAREVAVAEERGRGDARLATAQQAATLQEQTTFLKLQLQYAMKEHESELSNARSALAAAQERTAELTAALAAAESTTTEHEDLVAEFSAVVQQQKSTIQALERERENLMNQLSRHSPEAFEALVGENTSLRRRLADLEFVRQQLDHAREQWQAAEKKLAEAQAQSARSLEEASAKLSSMEAALARAHEEAQVLTQRCEALSGKLSAAEDAVKIKVAMLDSANEDLSSLKAEVRELQAELDDTRHALEEAEAALAREGDGEDAEKIQLRADLAASRAETESAQRATRDAATRMRDTEGRLREAEARVRDAEERCRSAVEKSAEKEAMIKYVSEEVDRVKELFEGREARLRTERDSALAAAEQLRAERDVAQDRVAELGSRMLEIGDMLDSRTQSLEVERARALRAKEDGERAAAEVVNLRSKLVEMEGEMRALLEAVERQKEASANKMKQLAYLLQDL